MVNSITNSTLKQYESSLKHWWEFAHLNDVEFFNPNTSDIITFLHIRFNKGGSYSTLNTTRSAISLISLSDINSNGLISRFMKGIYKQRPTRPRYATTWDVTSVLNFLEKIHPLKDFSLKEIAEKLATLLALTTAQRLQTLSLINIDNITQSHDSIYIKITEQIKTSKPGVFQPELVLPFFKEKPGLCVASTLLEYCDRTKNTRKDIKVLFLTTTKPHKAASSQTISHWIKSVLQKAGIDTHKFTAYSTKHTAVSTAYRKGIDISIIRNSAGWTPKSKIFFKFYNRPIQAPNDSFARAILQ